MEKHYIHIKVVLSSVSLETQQKTTQQANNGSLTTTENATKNIAYTVKKQYNGEAKPTRQDLQHWSTTVEATMTNCRNATCCFATRHNDNPITDWSHGTWVSWCFYSAHVSMVIEKTSAPQISSCDPPHRQPRKDAMSLARNLKHQ